MNANKVNWVSTGTTIFFTLFFVFCILSIVNSMSFIRISKLGIESKAPANLKRAPETFRLSLLVESHDFPVEEMTKTESWSKLQNAASAYAERLDFIESQNRRRAIWTSFFYVLSGIGMAVFSVLNVLNCKRNKGDT